MEELKVELGITHHQVARTRSEISDGIDKAWVSVTAKEITRRYDAVSVDGMTPDNAPSSGRRIALRPFSAFAHALPVDPEAPHGLVLRYQDRRFQWHDIPIPRSILEDRKALWQFLGGLGIQIYVDPVLRSAAHQYLIEANPDTVIRTYNKPGWYELDKKEPIFALPDQILGDPDGLLDKHGSAIANTNQRGTLEGWRETMEDARVFPMSEFAMCFGFAPVLLPFVDFSEDGGFHIHGGTSTGKSIALEVAASIWGAPKHTAGVTSYLQTWNTTLNYVEAMAEASNHLPLIMDEIGEASARTVADSAYIISDGQGKRRLDRTGKARTVRKFRTLALSSGEISIHDKISKAAHHFGGQVIRFCDIDIQSGNLYISDVEAARAVKSRLSEDFGLAGPEFAKALRTYPERAGLKKRHREITEILIGKSTDPRKGRAASRFALVELAGKIAKELGLLPESIDPEGIINRTWNAWTGDAGEEHGDDNRTAARRLVDYIEPLISTSIIRVDKDNYESDPRRGRIDGWLREPTKKDPVTRLYLLRQPLADALGDYSLRAFVRHLRTLAAQNPDTLRDEPWEIIRTESAAQLNRKTPRFRTEFKEDGSTASTSNPRTYQFDLIKLRAFADGTTDLSGYGDFTDKDEEKESKGSQCNLLN